MIRISSTVDALGDQEVIGKTVVNTGEALANDKDDETGDDM